MRSSVVAAILVAVALPASAAPRDDAFNRYVSPRLDGTPVTVENVATGQTWTAWSYAQSGELDLALSVREGDGRWSPPRFLGERDGVDQIDPALIADAAGVVYLAYAERGTGKVHIAALPHASATWNRVTSFETTAGPVAAPSLKIVGGRLVIAFRAGRTVEIHDLALIAPNSALGIDDGPDPFGGAGQNGNGGTRGWKGRK
ncbi:MAG TPA: hypothetical protein VF139_12740 [Candidatus Polarisedimenticolaceae bacterium]